MRRLVMVILVLAFLLVTAAPALAVHSGCVQEAEPRTDHAAFGCEQMPPPPVEPPGRS